MSLGVGCVFPPVVVNFAGGMSVCGTDHEAVRAGHDHSGQALVWGLTPWSGSHFSVALVPAESALWICCLWSCMDSALCGLKPAAVCWCWSL